MPLADKITIGPWRLARALDSSVLLIMVVALLFVALSLGYVGQSYAINEQSPDPGGIPFRWVVKGLIPLGYCLLVLQSAGQLMRIVQTYRAPGELDDV